MVCINHTGSLLSTFRLLHGKMPGDAYLYEFSQKWFNFFFFLVWIVSAKPREGLSYVFSSTTVRVLASLHIFCRRKITTKGNNCLAFWCCWEYKHPHVYIFLMSEKCTYFSLPKMKIGIDSPFAQVRDGYFAYNSTFMH